MTTTKLEGAAKVLADWWTKPMPHRAPGDLTGVISEMIAHDIIAVLDLHGYVIVPKGKIIHDQEPT